jgi:hypothetical protein
VSIQIIPGDPLGGSLFQEGTMSRKMQIRLSGLGAALLASLAFAPLAQALPDPGSQVAGTSKSTPKFSSDRAFHVGIGTGPARTKLFQTTPTYRGAIPPDRSDGLGRGALVTAGVLVPPDRSDRFGTSGGARAVPTSVVFTSDSSFSWIDALIGGGVALAAGLLAGLGVMIARRHGGVAQPS